MWGLVLVAIFALHDNPPRKTQAEVNNVQVAVETPKPKAKQVNENKPKKQEPVKPKPSPAPQPKQEVARPTVISGTKTDWLRAAGIPENEWGAVDYIVQKESSWNYLAVNRSSGATGLCQSLPASKMASAGADYMTNPITQLKWCHGYAHSRYGGWWKAYSFWVAAKWW